MEWIVENAEILKLIITLILGFASGFLPGLITSIKKKKEADESGTQIEKEKAKKDLRTKLKEFMIGAENLYKNISSVLGSQGIKTGELKKEQVMSNLQTYAISKGYEFDKEEWEDSLEEEITLTKEINA